MHEEAGGVVAGPALAGAPGCHTDENPTPTVSALEKLEREMADALEQDYEDCYPDEFFERCAGAIQGVGAQTLMEKVLQKPLWLVEGLLSTSSTVVFGSPPKYGKSFMALQLGQSVSMGKPFLGHKTTKSRVLYLALEDMENRVQRRLWELADESTDDFVIATQAPALGNGLIERLEDYLEDNPGTKLFIIDTLQVVRAASMDYSYSADYADMRKIKSFSDTYGVCVLVLTHLRKLVCPGDSFANISGTTGISGAVDQMMVLQKGNRHDRVCTLDITGRDVPDATLKLRRNGVLWELVEEVSGEQLEAARVPDCVKDAVDFVKNRGGAWSGSASELRDALGLENVTVAMLGKYLSQHREWMETCGVRYATKRTASARTVFFAPAEIQRKDDGNGESPSSGG